ncbi:hypothetical protein BESB_017980 [Besnoitia besnoiti]|uniref:RRM domain-containing protein n=1 Tax=Besnoitia besnoiti TaxID=94643 RepID=A0A2A9MAS2_BESBE|nr:hypothetical protein BESB_017980 [Besnoitia besnoiti]PFH32480.1 hypothetical protein BESB_017980 [Besnoitia besnoiti]
MADLKNLSSEKKLDMSLDELIAQTNASKGPQRRNNSGNAQQSQQQGRKNFHGNNQRQGPYSRSFGSNYRDAVGRDYLLEGSGGGYKSGGAQGPRQGGMNHFVPHVYTVKVKNLPLDVPEKELENLLRRHFGVCGNVVRIIFRQKNPGEAYVGFSESSSCSKALAELQNSKLKGHVLTIEKVRLRSCSPPTLRAPILVEVLMYGIDSVFSTRDPWVLTARRPLHGSADRPSAPAGRRGLRASRRPGWRAPGQRRRPPAFPRRRLRLRGPDLPARRRTLGASGALPPTLAYAPGRGAADPAFSNGATEYYADSRGAVAPVGSPVAYGGGSHGGASLVGKQAQTQAGSTIIISNVPCDLTAQELQDAFSVVGAVLRTELLLNAAGAPTGRVALTFESRHAALEAVRRFDGGDLNAHTIRVFLE